MSKQKLILVKKLGTLLVVGLVLLSNSPVLALPALAEEAVVDQVSVSENQIPMVENTEVTEVDEVVETEESDVTDNALENPEELSNSDSATTTDVAVLDNLLVDEMSTSTPSVEATSTDEVVVDEITPIANEVGEIFAPLAVAQALAADNTDNSFAISEEIGGKTDPASPVDSQSGESSENEFTTLPVGGCSHTCGQQLGVSVENNFTTMANGGCTSQCGSNSVGVSGENYFRTLSTDGCTSHCGSLPEGVSEENSFHTLSGGGGCTSNCGGDEEGVSEENSFTTLPSTTEPGPVSSEHTFTTLGGGGGCTSNCGGGGGGHSHHRNNNDDEELPAACPIYLKKFIRLGYNNDPEEVRKLEIFLRDFEGFEIPVNGVYEIHDFEAVSIFQKRYADAVLTPWGISDSTGYVYITTSLTINEIYCRHTVGNDLDLRQVFPVYTGGVVTGISNQPSATTTATGEVTTTPSILDDHNFFEAAAVGLLNFLKEWWCLLAIIILILIIAYLLDERERLLKKLNKGQAPNNLPIYTGHTPEETTEIVVDESEQL